MTRLLFHSIIAAGLSGMALMPRPVFAITPQSEQDEAQHSALSTQHSVLDVVGRFVEFVQQRESYPETVRRFIADEWHRRKTGQALRTFIPEALAVLHPRFKIGLDAYEARQYDYCAKIMGALSLNSNRYLSSYAALFQTKALVQEVQLEYAAMLLNFYLRDDFDVSQYCLDVAEMKFLQGYCLFHTFQIEQARDALNRFLEDYPESDPALRASARELLQSMSPPPRKDLGQVAHLMAEAGLWLTEGETGIDPQIKQAKALMILEEMIRSAQQQERQQQQQQQGRGQPSAQQAQTPQRPAGESALPQGKATQGQLHSAPRAAPGEVWGSMRPQQRARILQVLQENFPNRYRQLVEQYYKELAREQ